MHVVTKYCKLKFIFCIEVDNELQDSGMGERCTTVGNARSDVSPMQTVDADSPTRESVRTLA